MYSVNQSNFSSRKSKRKNETDMEKCCVCFGEENLHNINVQLEDNDISLLGALNYCLPDEIFSEKWTPPNMCLNCLNGLCYTYTFLQQVCTAQSILKNKTRKTKEKHSDLIDRIEIQRKTIKYHCVFLRDEHLDNIKTEPDIIDESHNELMILNQDHDYQKISINNFNNSLIMPAEQNANKETNLKEQKTVKKLRKILKTRRKVFNKQRTLKKDEQKASNRLNSKQNICIKVCNESNSLNKDNDEQKALDIGNNEQKTVDEDNGEEKSLSKDNNEQKILSKLINEMETLNKDNNEEETSNKDNDEQKVLIKVCNDLSKDDGSKTLLIIYNDEKPPKEVILKREAKPLVIEEEISPEEVVEVLLETNNGTTDNTKSPSYIRKSRVKDIKCNGCGLKFNQTRMYLKHMKTEHSLDTNVLCDICGKLCVNNAVLIKHKLSHSDERPFKCEVCLRNFKSLRQLNIHNKHKHALEENLNVFVCTVCSMKFMKVFELRHHLYTHTNQIPYACDICDRKFRLKDNLRKYKLEEDRNKPFTCDLCEQNDLVPNYADEVYITHFNVSKKIVENLSDKFRSSQYFHSHFGQHGGIPAINQVLIFLWYIGNKTQNYRIVAEKFNITISSLNRVIQRITTFLSGLSSEIIHWPTDEEKIDIESNFRKKMFPNVIGAIETFFIKIDKPRNEPRRYVNSKGEHSIKIQIVSDHQAKILDVFIGCPGSVHDSEVLENSVLGKNLKEKCGKYWLLGDSRYPLSRNLITPYKDKHLNKTQMNFNEKLLNSRNIVKVCFELLTTKFPQVSHVKLKDIELIVHFVRAVCVLHNISLEDDVIVFEENIDLMNDLHESNFICYDLEEDEEDNLIRDAVAELIDV